MKDEQPTHSPITGEKLKSIFVRCSKDEKERWQKASQIEGRSLSNFMRYALIHMCNRVENNIEGPYG